MRIKRPRRHVSAAHRTERLAVTAPNEVWSMDFVNHLNELGITRRGRRFGVGSLQGLITTSTYCGRHYFNKNDSRNKRKRPRSEWIQMAVPAIIDEDTFNRTQLTLRSRSPRNTPPRVIDGPTMLAGVARCAHCGAAMIQNTGKGGLYRYYCCSRKMKQGATACRGQRIRVDELDKTVLDYLSGQLFAQSASSTFWRPSCRRPARMPRSGRKSSVRLERREAAWTQG